MTAVAAAQQIDRCWQRIGVASRATAQRCPRLVELAHCHHCEVFQAAAGLLAQAPLDPAWRAEWATRYAAAAPLRAARGEELMLRLCLGREAYALSARQVDAAAAAGTAVALPGRRGRLVHGLFQVDGQLLLAADLRRLLHPVEWGKEPPGGRIPRMLVLGQGAAGFVCAVDDVPGSFRLNPELLQPMPHSAAATIAALARGVLREGDRVLTVLDADKLLAALAADLD